MMARLGAVLIAAQLAILLCGTEGAPLAGEVVELGDHQVGLPSEVGEGSGSSTASFPSAGAGGSGSGSAAFDPSPLKKPYERHMEPNKPMWSKIGGWSGNHEKALEKAKAAIARADKYVHIKKKEKEISEMGCPCPGEKYEDLVENPKKLHEQVAMGAAASKAAAAARGSGAGSGVDVATGMEAAGSGDGEEDLEKDADPSGKKDPLKKALDSNTFKKMLKKYGKLGPNSSWKPSDDKFLKIADSALKAANLEADALFVTAIPEFKQMKLDNPDFFANGKCKCPESWTLKDAAALTQKAFQDKEHAYWEGMRMHREMVAEMSGEKDRIAAQESAGEPPDSQMP